MTEVLSFESNDYLFNILDGWIEKYNTSPKILPGVPKESSSLSIQLNGQAQGLLNRTDVIAELKRWAIENQKLVIVSGFCIVVLTASAIGTALQRNSLRGLRIEKGSLFFSSSNIAALSDTTEGVYFIDDNQMVAEETIDTLSVEESKSKTYPSITLPGNALIDNYLIKNSLNQFIDEYMQAKTREAFASPEQAIEPYSMEEPAVSEEVYEEVQPVVLANGGIEIVIPSYVRQTGLCPNHTSYTYFYGRWSRGSGQKALSEQWGAAGKPSSNGIATLNGRYLVAVSPKFGVVGDNIDIVLSDGQVIPATIADIKGVDATSEWGHVLIESTQAVDIIEWESTGAKSDINLGTWRNVTVAKIINYGKDVVPVYEEETQAINSEAWQHIEKYSEAYGLNSEKVYQIISDLTDNFSSDSYKQSNAIGSFAGSSKEASIILCIRSIYYNPSYYGVTAQEIKGATLYHSSSSYASQLQYISNLLGVDSSLNYAICEAACSFSSPIFINQNNPTSIMINGSYATFPTVTAGFIEQTVEVLNLILSGEDPKEVIGARTGNAPDELNPDSLELYNNGNNVYDDTLTEADNNHVLAEQSYALRRYHN